MDLDGDGLVDSVLVLESSEDVEKHGQAFAHEEGELLHCSIMVVSGLPPRSQLFNGSICSSRHSLSNPSRQKKIPHVVFAAPPLVLRKLGSDNIQEASQKDLAVAVNTGSVTLFKTVKGSGGLSWQSDDGPTWELDFKHAAIKSFDADSKRVAEHGTHDTAYSDLLVMGDKSLLLLDREGEQKTKADIPSTPIAQPILADFDNDEISDVIIVTAEAIYGYKIEVKTSTRGLLVAIILLAALAFMIYVTSIRYSVVDDKRSVVGNDTHTAKRKVLSLARSTEEYHLD